MPYSFFATVCLIFIIKNVYNLNLDFNQNMYSISLERANPLRYNTKYIGLLDVRSFKTRTEGILLNLTIIYLFDLPDELKTNIQAFQFLSNVYKPTNINMTVDTCKMIKMNVAGMEVLRTTNGNFSYCPLQRGTYVIYNFRPNARKFPPLIPEGRYKLVLLYYYQDLEIFSYEIYGAVIYGTRSSQH